MKYFVRTSFLLALMGAVPAFAQSDAGEEVAEPEPEVSAPTPEVAEPEPEVSEPEPEVSEPEPEVSEPEPEVSRPAPGSGAEELGRAAAEPSVDEDIAEAAEEATTPPEAAAAAEGGDGGEDGEELDTASRLAQANPMSGLPWSIPIVWANTITARTLAPRAQQTYNPYYNMTFSARPRWAFSNGLSLGARQDVDIEWTDSGLGAAFANPTNANRQVYWQDLRLDATYAKGLPGGFGSATSLSLRVPTSTFSRGETRVLGINPAFMLMRPVPVAGGLIPGIQVSYLYWATQSNVGQPMRRDGDRINNEEGDATVVSSTPNQIASARCRTAGVNGAIADGDCGDGTGVTEHQFAATVFATLIPIPRMAISMAYTTLWLRGANLATGCLTAEDDDVITADGGPLCIGDNSDTKWRIFSVFSLSIGYDITPYLTGSIGYSTLAIHPDSDGNGIENPIWNENTQLSLNFQFRPAGFVVSRRQAAEEAAANATNLTPTAF